MSLIAVYSNNSQCFPSRSGYRHFIEIVMNKMYTDLIILAKSSHKNQFF